jgi:hypothetical protein
MTVESVRQGLWFVRSWRNIAIALIDPDGGNTTNLLLLGFPFFPASFLSKTNSPASGGTHFPARCGALRLLPGYAREQTQNVIQLSNFFPYFLDDILQAHVFLGSQLRTDRIPDPATAAKIFGGPDG